MSRAERGPRRPRIPMGVPRSKLSVQGMEEGYVYRWFNDHGGRIQQATQAGYEFAKDVTAGDTGERNSDIGSKVSQLVGAKEDGSPLRAYLMRIKREWYLEDQTAKQADINETDESIRHGQIGKEHGDGHTYIPSTGIRYG